ncbi:MAG: serine/threonine protein kinase, partial [Acidimicrobiales bacterium]|nr:serine/threonine protein kinase [Acidimicrobiales bacterium]
MSEDATPGAVVEGYEGLERIGRGGFATVYRARQRQFDRVVALKVLDVTDTDAASRQRFERECRAIGALSWHPHIVVVHDSGQTADGRLFLAMEFLEAGSLADRVRAEGALPWPDVARAGVEVCAALETAHQAGTLHRDLKPDNVLVGVFGEAKLGDFGIAAVEGGPATATGESALTVLHAAPEVLRGERATVASDVYSLASTLYTLLAGRAAFAREGDDSVAAVVLRAVSEPVPDLRPRGVPDDLAGVLERAMDKDPARRPPSAEAFGRELQQVQRAHGGPVTELRLDPRRAAAAAPSDGRGDDAPTVLVGGRAGAPSPPPRAGRSRRGVVSALVGVALVVLVVAAAGAWRVLGRDDGGEGAATTTSAAPATTAARAAPSRGATRTTTPPTTASCASRAAPPTWWSARRPAGASGSPAPPRSRTEPTAVHAAPGRTGVASTVARVTPHLYGGRRTFPRGRSPSLLGGSCARLLLVRQGRIGHHRRRGRPGPRPRPGHRRVAGRPGRRRAERARPRRARVARPGRLARRRRGRRRRRPGPARGRGPAVAVGAAPGHRAARRRPRATRGPRRSPHGRPAARRGGLRRARPGHGHGGGVRRRGHPLAARDPAVLPGPAAGRPPAAAPVGRGARQRARPGPHPHRRRGHRRGDRASRGGPRPGRRPGRRLGPAGLAPAPHPRAGAASCGVSAPAPARSTPPGRTTSTGRAWTTSSTAACSRRRPVATTRRRPTPARWSSAWCAPPTRCWERIRRPASWGGCSPGS